MGRKKADVQPHWHPDFRIESTLPDIKVVRTGFIINFVAVTLVLVATFYVLQREYRAYVLQSTLEDMERRITAAEADDRGYLEMSERFRAAARHIEELQRFFSSPIRAHEFLADLTAVKPEDLIFSRVTVSELLKKEGETTGIEYIINITGEVKELTILNQFKGRLQTAEFLQPEGFVTEVDETVQSPDAETRIFPYRISITLRPEALDAAAKGTGGRG